MTAFMVCATGSCAPSRTSDDIRYGASPRVIAHCTRDSLPVSFGARPVLTSDTQRRIDACRNILVGKLPLPPFD